ncbi:MAG: mechanosensitive ion channel family protein [Rhodobiaceae bacterium]|nr:mechanosensitive ion channel family protein [Rhodobiaceae bacterium]
MAIPSNMAPVSARRWLQALLLLAAFAIQMSPLHAQTADAPPRAAPSQSGPVGEGAGPSGDATEPPAATPAPAPAPEPAQPAPIAAAQIDDERTAVAEWKGIVDRVEAALRRQLDDDQELAQLRRELDPIRSAAPTVISSLQDRVRIIEERTTQLGPAPAEGEAQEAPAVRAEREALNAALADVRGVLSQARVILVQSEQLEARISERRRDRFTARLFERNRAPFEPSLWRDTLPQFPQLQRRFNLLLDEGTRGAIANLSPSPERTASDINLRLATIVLSVIAGAALVFVGRHRLAELYRRVPRDSAPSRLEKFAGATWLVVVDGLVPVFAISLVILAVAGSGFLPDRLMTFVRSAATGVSFYVFLRAIAIAVLAPRAPSWRLLDMPHEAAWKLKRVLLVIAAVAGIDEFLNSTFDLLAASLSIEVLRSGTFALTTAALGLLAVRIIAHARPLGETEHADADADQPVAVARSWGWARAALTLLFLAILAATVLGYVALAAYASTHVVLAGAIITVATLLVLFTDELANSLVNSETGPASAIARSLGLSRSATDQIIVILSGVFRLFLIVATVVMVLLPWGFDTRQWTGWLRGAFFGIQVGEITISFSTILSALAIFVVGLLATRTIQRWLDTRYLPRTSLDIGLKSSVSTALGYVGFLVAAAVAVSFAGFDLASLAIVAGALSVGIGFGLQSIVNNFVSGLILLAERPVKVGDWIKVGEEQGYVRRISVRATEIQTFDRATVIVPNSDLISGTVKNMMLSDRTGRIRIPIGVGYDSDPDKVRDVLLEVARDHPGILAFPEPRAYFLDFGASSLDFQLYAYLSDVDNSLSVSSDLRYAILKRFREEGIEIPFPQSDVHIRGPLSMASAEKSK